MIKKAIIALMLGAGMMGCGSSAVAMLPAQGAADARAVEGQAVVVFVRHSRLGKKVSFPIVTEGGQFVAILRGQMHATVSVPAGHHRFFVLAENADVVEVNAEPGRVYVVETRPRMGWGKARVTVEAVKRETPRFAEAPEWIRDTPGFTPDPVAGAAWASEHRENIMERVQSGLTDWNAGDAAYRASRTLEAGDGYLPAEISW
jgi:hypothetical protein